MLNHSYENTYLIGHSGGNICGAVKSTCLCQIFPSLGEYFQSDIRRTNVDK